MLFNKQLQGPHLLVHDDEGFLLGEGDDAGLGRIDQVAAEKHVQVMTAEQEILKPLHIGPVDVIRQGMNVMIHSQTAIGQAQLRHLGLLAKELPLSPFAQFTRKDQTGLALAEQPTDIPFITIVCAMLAECQAPTMIICIVSFDYA